MVSITKKFEFESAHYLPDYPGKCNNTHGHSYKLYITVTHKEKYFKNMIIDFSELKKIIQNEIISLLDHIVLNKYFNYPSAENIVLWIKEKLLLIERKRKDIIFTKIVLYETSDSYAEWTYENE